MSPNPHDVPPAPRAPWSGRKKLTVAVGSALGAVVLVLCGLTALGAIIGSDDTDTEPAAPAGARAAATHSAKKDGKYEALTAARWQEVAADLPGHLRDTYTVYGVVTQADSVIGPEAVLADTDGVAHSEAYEYPTNAVFTGDREVMDRLIEGDQFVAQVTVLGPYEYDTDRGKVTAPSLRVNTVDIRIPAPGDRP